MKPVIYSMGTDRLYAYVIKCKHCGTAQNLVCTSSVVPDSVKCKHCDSYIDALEVVSLFNMFTVPIGVDLANGNVDK